MNSFGEQRLVRRDVGLFQRFVFRCIGVADPAHYLHNRYVKKALESRQVKEPRWILDAGCGSGDHTLYLARRFPHARVLGVDIQETLIRRNREAAAALGISNVRFEVADITQFEAAERFDLITSIDVLEHIVKQQIAINNLVRHLAPGGTTIFHVPTVRPVPVLFSKHLTDFHEWAEKEHVADEVTADGFVEVCEAAGINVLDWKRTFGRWTGELATSLFALPYRNTAFNRIFQLLLVIPCRALTVLDSLEFDKTRYAVLVVGTRD